MSHFLAHRPASSAQGRADAAAANADDAAPGMLRFPIAFLSMSFDRKVLLLTCGVWVVNYVMTGTMFHFIPGYPNDAAIQFARAASYLIASGLCMAMHRMLKHSIAKPRQLLLRTMLVTIPAAVAMTVLGGWVFRTFTRYTQDPQMWLKPGVLAVDYVGYQWMFFTWGALYISAAYAVAVQQRDRQLAATQYAAQRAQMMALRLQVNPHFLFNALNTLAGLIVMGRTSESEAMVLNLSRFLRHTLSSAPSPLTTVDDEVRMLGMYLDIETARFPDRLRVEYAIGAACRQATLPGLILLPLVENAIKHGLGDSEDGITLTIAARRLGTELELRVSDEGAAHRGPTRDGLGIGLSNIQQRLHAQYGGAAGLRVEPSPRGWHATIHLPYQDAD